ncbi:TrbC/VirB2 family protein [Xanthomonas campestris pv. campestris]|uniref:TrbC/VirB2 family protein n=1 Tax=Xanthomonas campestris TaxID=339 RepID=UPI00226989F8|nr:TrbC/VirB2 family protein [Xanthomonas campestris]MEB1347131.1 TrbC/VirB2 family protein [Xanthomonas campestris pv. campestris]WDK48113.1 TrbC/VirB2 family protein [Xanthomonas campestris pv. campestris]WDK55631.1 TrbC/VirB2 family protein [Xanthomonas campestris pv. campestris]WDL64468.1 TrbC/VirB2 family protein [Xanthomonas campestris pv. campestris]WDL68464.1 TrbC/VirB2 family protein [Xanthomonas campestris pv. campestris]
MKFEIDKKLAADAKMIGAQALKALVFTSLLLAAGGAVATETGLGDTGEKMCGFLNNVNGLLNMGSALVVTIAVVIAGYQIAFAHKRISEVSPILIGGVLIGAAAQIANMVIGGDGTQGCSTSSMMLLQSAQYYA